jgi:ubiquinone biosynthesis protein
MIFRRIPQFFRFLEINYVLLRHGLDRVVLSHPKLHPFRFLSHLNPFNWFREPGQSHGESIRLALENLGPIFVIFGQVLSTRRDVIPDDIADELAKLQDQVPSFPGLIAKQILEKAYGKPVSEVFQTFQTEPMASASIAQAHLATLEDGSEVVVKVLRPGIRQMIRRDVALMYVVASLAEKFWSEGKRLRPRDVVEEFEKTLLDELDLMREAANASQLRRNFTNSPLLYVPEVYWDYTRSNVLVTERIAGIPISHISVLKEHGINLKKLAENGVEIFFHQVFHDSFFHADMHPGNIFVCKENKDNPKYLAVDFGIVGSLSPTDQRYLAENLLAFFKRDYRQVAILHVESGWVPRGTRIEEFESAIRAVCEPIFEKPLHEISFGKLLLRLFQTASRFNMEVQPQLLLLQKTLLSIEGLGRQLYPKLDLWTTAKPFLERWLQEKIGGKALIKNVVANAPYWAEKFPDVPDLIYRVLQLQSQRARDPEPVVVVSPQKSKRVILLSGLMLLLAAGLNVIFLNNTLEMRQILQYSLLGAGGLFVLISLF